MGIEREDWEEFLGDVRVSSEPCNPTTSVCARPTHFVRRKRKEELRSKVVPVRFTESERATIKGFAEARRLSLSDFIRKAVLGRKMPVAVPPEINRGVYRELARVGNNLNQLIRAINSGVATVANQQLLEELANVVRRLAHQLIQGHK